MVKVATWNVNSVTIRQNRLLAFLKREAPDLVCLQELKCLDEKIPVEALRAAGYYVTAVGQKAYNGVAVLSREEPTVLALGLSDGVDDAHARMVAVRAHGINCISVYVPNGQEVGTDKYYYKLNWLARLRRYLDRTHQEGEPVIVAGDYNVAPDDRDVYDPAALREHLLCSTREREALAHVQGFGLADAYRTLYPKETQFTWWDYRLQGFQHNHGLRIDLFLATPSVMQRATKCWVDRDERIDREGDKPSDHAPVLLEIK